MRTTNGRLTRWRTMRRAALALLALGAIPGCTSAPLDTGEVEIVGTMIPTRPGEDVVVHEIRRLGSDGARALVVFFGDEAYASSLDDAEPLGFLCDLDATLAVVERPGVRLDQSVDRRAAMERSRKDDRVLEGLVALDGVIGRWGLRGGGIARSSGTPVILAGLGEGGQVAATIAARNPRVTHLILLNTGGGWTRADELRQLVREGDAGVAGLDVDDVEALDARLEAIRGAPDSMDLWAGHPSRRWASYLFSSPRAEVLGLTIPVLLIQGDADRLIPVESARSLAGAGEERGLANLTYLELRAVGHDLHGRKDASAGAANDRAGGGSGGDGTDEVREGIARWLHATGAIGRSEMDRVIGGRP